MGFRFRKSVKIAPGVKLNIGKKSIGLSIGGEYGGISHNTRTGTQARVTAYGTGLSYTTKLGEKRKMKTQKKKNNVSRQTTNAAPTGNKKKSSCLMTCLKFFLGFALLPCILAFGWIAGIVWFIFFRKRLDNDPEKQKKATTKYSILTVLSLLLFCFSISGDSTTEPTETTVIVAGSEISTKEYSAELKSVPETEAEIETETTTEVFETLEETPETTVTDDEMKTGTYIEQEEIVSKTEEHNADEVIENNIVEPSTEDIISSTTTSGETTQNTIEPSTPPVVDTPSQTNTTMVWIDDTAKRYHKKNGCGMNNAYQVTLDEAIAKGKTSCGRCYK